MADAALKNAIARQRELRDKMVKHREALDRIRQEQLEDAEALDEINSFIRMWHHMAGSQPDAEQEQTEPSVSESKTTRPKNPDRMLVVEKCVEYIRTAGKPLARRELFDRLQKDGIIIRGKDAEMVLSTMLWRTKDLIKRLPQGGYWPVADTLPMAFGGPFKLLPG